MSCTLECDQKRSRLYCRAGEVKPRQTAVGAQRVLPDDLGTLGDVAKLPKSSKRHPQMTCRAAAGAENATHLAQRQMADPAGPPCPKRRPPPRPSHLPPRPIVYVIRGDSLEVPPPIPRRPAPPPPTPDSEIARRIVSVVLGRIWASNLVLTENLPGPAASLILSHFLY